MEALDAYLRRFARQHAGANMSRSYVAAEGTSWLLQPGHVGHPQRKPAGETAQPIAEFPATGRAAGAFGGGYAPPALSAW